MPIYRARIKIDVFSGKAEGNFISGSKRKKLLTSSGAKRSKPSASAPTPKMTGG
jgi:hypothetical protein